MTNIYVFWKKSSLPDSPWTRVTRTTEYFRMSDNPTDHWTQTGSTTHTPTVSNWYCATGGSLPNSGSAYSAMERHTHSEPSSWTISSANNNPLSYGLDIIYMDLTTWELSERRFPSGAVVLSNGTLTETDQLTRFTSADGYYITNNTPGTIAGTSSTHNHRSQGTTGSSGTSYIMSNYALRGIIPAAHTHTIDLYSNSQSNEPRNIVTRMYEALQITLGAESGTVVFIDGTPSANWEILDSWTGANLKAGNSNPTISGSDTDSHSVSGNTSSYYGSDERNPSDNFDEVTIQNHVHAVSFDLTSSKIPLSRKVVPAQLLNNLYHRYNPRSCIVGI